MSTQTSRTSSSASPRRRAKSPVLSENRKPKTENSPARPRRPWTPTDTDHRIYQWFKMDGHTQDWVAYQFGISQGTVSRIVDRYERWQAHAQERENGSLDHTERLRAQRWLTFQRNEKIVASCLRLAEALEGFVDTSCTTTQHPGRYPSEDTVVRTQHFAIDRTASVSRFLRLAFRVNMEQLKLATLAPPPPARPLSPEEYAAEEAEVAIITQEYREAEEHREKRQAEREQEEAHDTDTSDVRWAAPTSPLASPTSTEPTSSPTSNLEPETCNLKPETPSSPTLDLGPGTLDSSSPSPAHNAHNPPRIPDGEISPTPSEPCTCDSAHTPTKKSRRPRITEPQWPADTAPLPSTAPKNGRPPHPRSTPRELATPPTRRARKKPR